MLGWWRRGSDELSGWRCLDVFSFFFFLLSFPSSSPSLFTFSDFFFFLLEHTSSSLSLPAKQRFCIWATLGFASLHSAGAFQASLYF